MDTETLVSALRARRGLPSPAERRAIRVAAGATQAEVAAALGCARETVSRWETGRNAPQRGTAWAGYVELLGALREVAAEN